MKKKKVSANILIIILLLVSFLPQINGYNAIDSYENKSTSNEIVYMEYYPGASFDINICYYVPDQLIVKFEDSVDVSSLNNVKDYQILKWDADDNAVLIEAKDTDLTSLVEQLNDQENVVYAELNGIVFACNDPPNDPLWGEQWGHQMIKCTDAWEEITGENIRVAVLDTGIDADHEDFDAEGKILYQKDYVNGGNIAEDDSFNGHGTHNSGIIGACYNNNVGIAGVAPDCNIIAIKVLDGNNEVIGNAWEVADAIEWATDIIEVDIISMSFVINADYEHVKKECDAAKAAGVVLVASAGNNQCERILWPANYSSVIAVGAINQTKQKCNFSNYGENLDFVAPGKDIISTIQNDEYGYSSGTSAATAYVAGIFALLKQKYPGYTQDELKEELIKISEDLGEPGKDKYYGYGLAMAYKNYPPVVVITYPEDGTDIKPGALIVRGTADDENEEPLVIHAIIYWYQSCTEHDDFVKTADVINNAWQFSMPVWKDTEYTITVRSFDGELYSEPYSISFKGVRNKNLDKSIQSRILELLSSIPIFQRLLNL